MALPAVDRSADFVVRFFVLWVFLAAGAALIWPAGFTWFQPLIIPGLGVIMFGMGTALTLADFKRVVDFMSMNRIAAIAIYGFLLVTMMIMRPQGLLPERRRAQEMTHADEHADDEDELAREVGEQVDRRRDEDGRACPRPQRNG